MMDFNSSQFQMKEETFFALYCSLSVCNVEITVICFGMPQIVPFPFLFSVFVSLMSEIVTVLPCVQN